VYNFKLSKKLINFSTDTSRINIPTSATHLVFMDSLNITLILRDALGTMMIEIDKHLLIDKCAYLDTQLNNKPFPKIIDVANTNVAHDIIMKLRGRATRSGNLSDWRYAMEYVKCCNDWKLEFDTPINEDLNIPVKHFESFFDVLGTIGYTDVMIKLLVKNLPKNYCLSKFPDNVTDHLLKTLESDYRIIYLCANKFYIINSRNYAIKKIDYGREILQPNMPYISLINYLPSRNQIIAVELGGTVRIWNDMVKNNLSTVVEVSLGTSIIKSVYLPKRQQIICVTHGNDIVIFDINTNRSIKFESVLSPSKPIKSLAGSPSGDQIACGDIGGSIHILGITNSSACYFIRTICTVKSRIKCLTYSPCGCFLVSGNKMGDVKVWSMPSGHKIINLVPYPYRGFRSIDRQARGLIYSPNGRQLAFNGSDYILVVDVSNGKLVHELYTRFCICNICYSPKSDCIIIAGYVKIKRWDMSSGRVMTISKISHPTQGICVTDLRIRSNRTH
jgi:WD40 repeat protein